MNAQKDKILSYEREVTNNEGKITYSQSLLPSFDDEKSNCTSNISKFTKLVNKYSNGFRKSCHSFLPLKRQRLESTHTSVL